MSAAVSALRSFAAAERLVAEVSGDARRPGYVLLGDESFLYEICRRGILQSLVPGDLRDFCLHDLDLAETSIFEALDLAQTPSLMAPFQVLFLRNIKTLYGRGQKKDEFAAIDEYFRRPNPQALLIFVADHIKLPQDLRKMDMQDKERAERIRETLGDACGVVELQRVSEDDAVRWVMRQAEAKGVRFQEDAARELVDALGAEMLTIQSELEKLMLYAGTRGDEAIDVADVETMVAAAKQRSLYELTDAISLKDAPRALALLHGLLNASDGGEDAAIGHIFTLAKTFRQMLVLNEKQVKDQRAMWQVLWPGFRVAPFAADALIAQARRYRDRGELTRGLRLIAKADLELRSSPADKRLVLERLVMRLAGKTRVPELELLHN
ncbi:DNA polymerase III subunit delta [Granulicella sp. S156]|jgi:DNA polymerase-3 subunit delta|uniref:DNA polymerase III subunit delta n=1 Tax=Granulicella sp. S156 TaxID=1747224 RepID=UPI00131DE83D|nr:DNA polymerase III subunit delta [Granulicella sp. S156]